MKKINFNDYSISADLSEIVDNKHNITSNITDIRCYYSVQVIDYKEFISDFDTDILGLTTYEKEADGLYSNEAIDFVNALDFNKLLDIIGDSGLSDKLFDSSYGYIRFEEIKYSHDLDYDNGSEFYDLDNAETFIKVYTNDNCIYINSWDLYSDELETYNKLWKRLISEIPVNLKTFELNKNIKLETRNKFRFGSIVYKNMADNVFIFRDNLGNYTTHKFSSECAGYAC